MGGGSWTRKSFSDYSTSVGRNVTSDGRVSGDYRAQDMFKSRRIDEALNPKNVIRECADSGEHPYTIPVILGLDVTGSMGDSAVQVAKQLNIVMTSLYERVKDIEFLVMGIGDLAYDNAPIQASQFESDIRIAEQLDKVYFEGGGGGNNYESYTAAWYFGARHTKLDCLNRGRKGIIITIGDEPLNPYLPARPLEIATGDDLQGDIETKDLYEEVTEKFDVYHLVVQHGFRDMKERCFPSWSNYLDEDHLIMSSVNEVVDDIIEIIVDTSKHQGDVNEDTQENTSNNHGGISW